MKIFEVSASQITLLDEYQLVELLRRLVTAELKKHDIPLSSGTVPAQITLPDGGEDGRVHWENGPASTSFLPNRYICFQCKKTDPGNAGLKNEVWTRPSRKNGEERELNDALKEAIQHSGAYIIVTASAVVGTKTTERINAIKDGIQEANGDYSQLAAIKIYDSNRLANWTNEYPAVALWLNSILGEINLRSFQDFERWERSYQFNEIPYQCLDEERFESTCGPLANNPNPQINAQRLSRIHSIKSLTAEFDNFYNNGGRSIRIVGPSGYGKTRLIHALFSNVANTPSEILDPRLFVYANFHEVKDSIVSIARELAQSDSRTVIIIDECPDGGHKNLYDAMKCEKSKSLLITIGFETNFLNQDNNWLIQVKSASGDLIKGIAKTVSGEEDNRNMSFVEELAQGFPRMAVMATKAIMSGDHRFDTVQALVDRIVWGDDTHNDEALLALQALSLFTVLGLENDPDSELQEVAIFFNIDPTKMFSLIRSFEKRGIVVRYGDFAEAQPIPLATRLALFWLETVPNNTLENLLRVVSPDLQLRILKRLRWLASEPKVQNAVRNLLHNEITCFADLDSETSSQLLDRIVHIIPDDVMNHLENITDCISIEELCNFITGRRNTINALNKLVFRQESFYSAAKLLLKLAAAENEEWANNATGEFITLYNLQLSGTEAEPSEKLALLDEELQNLDDRIQEICIDALGAMLKTHGFSRMGGPEQIGSGKPLRDWIPKTYKEIFDYYRAALNRLKSIALDDNNSFHQLALKHIGNHFQSLLIRPNLFNDVRETILDLKAKYPRWHQPLLQINNLLYYHSDSLQADDRQRIREFYDELLPSDLIEKILLYSTAHAMDLHNPDKPQNPNLECNRNDPERDESMIKKLIAECPTDSVFFIPILKEFTLGDYRAAGLTLQLIAQHVTNPEHLLEQTYQLLNQKESSANSVHLLRSIIYEINQVDKAAARKHLEYALAQTVVIPHTIDFAAIAGIDEHYFELITDRISSSQIPLQNVRDLAFKDLNQVSLDSIAKLIEVLLNLNSEGVWKAIDFCSYYYDKNQLTPADSELIKKVIVDEKLLKQPVSDWMQIYYWKTLIEKLFDNNLLDSEFAQICTQFINSLIHIKDYHILSDFAKYAKEILRKTIVSYPEIVWEIYTEEFEKSKDTKFHRLSRLYGPDIGNPEEAGILDLIPISLIEAWIDGDKKSRLPVVLRFINMFDNCEENQIWDLKFIEFIDKNIQNAAELDIIISRFLYGSWVGPYSEKLEKALEQIKQLRNQVQHRHLRKLISNVESDLIRTIKSEKRKEQNEEAQFSA